MRYFITLSYDGTRYHGWQVQPHDLSVQEELQRALSLLLRADIQVTGAGRTDTGVHATMMVAHFDTDRELDGRQLAYKLNKLLPQDIAIQKIEPVSDELHARFSATARTYHYYIHTAKDPFVRNYSCELHYALDFDRMNEAAQHLFEYTDFTSFSKLHTDVKTNNCRIMKAEWVRQADGTWMFEVQADRFLRNMVRAIVGTLVDVGRGKISVQDFCDIIEKKDRCSAGQSMPGIALFLAGITYPEDIVLP